MSKRSNKRDNSNTAYRLADYFGETATPLAGHGTSSPQSGSFESEEPQQPPPTVLKTSNSTQTTITTMGDSPESLEETNLDDPHLGKVIYFFLILALER